MRSKIQSNIQHKIRSENQSQILIVFQVVSREPTSWFSGLLRLHNAHPSQFKTLTNVSSCLRSRLARLQKIHPFWRFRLPLALLFDQIACRRVLWSKANTLDERSNVFFCFHCNPPLQTKNTPDDFQLWSKKQEPDVKHLTSSNKERNADPQILLTFYFLPGIQFSWAVFFQGKVLLLPHHHVFSLQEFLFTTVDE